MSSVMAAVTAATTVAAPILSYAADLTETDSSAQTQTITNDDGIQTILNTSEGNETADSTEVSSEDEAEETRFLFLKLKNTGGKIVINKGEDEEHTVRLVKHKSEDGKTDEEKIDVYDKDDVLVSSEDAAKNNYTYAYEVKSDSVANVKAEADEGYVLKKYEVKAGDANKKADLNADDVSDSYEPTNIHRISRFGKKLRSSPTLWSSCLEFRLSTTTWVSSYSVAMEMVIA